MWQALYEELKHLGFLPIAVALESRGADSARPWIERAKATYPCVIDVEHRVATLYRMLNVPQAVWIDEQGRIVRPTESAGVTDGFRKMDTTTYQMPQDELVRAAKTRGVYLDAIRNWVANGATSPFALDAREAAAHTPEYSPEAARAMACFRLGQRLVNAGRREEGFELLEEAIRLHPDSWSIWRQTADLDTIGKSGGPEFWARVQALGERRYYAPVDMPNIPD